MRKTFVDGLKKNYEQVAVSKKPHSRLEYKNRTLVITRKAKIDTLLMTETAEKPYALGPHVTYVGHIKRVPPMEQMKQDTYNN